MDFMQWYNQIATPQEKDLADKISGYEPLFEDMTFSDDMFVFCIPDEIRYFDITQVQFKVEPLADKAG